MKLDRNAKTRHFCKKLMMSATVCGLTWLIGVQTSLGLEESAYKQRTLQDVNSVLNSMGLESVKSASWGVDAIKAEEFKGFQAVHNVDLTNIQEQLRANLRAQIRFVSLLPESVIKESDSELNAKILEIRKKYDPQIESYKKDISDIKGDIKDCYWSIVAPTAFAICKGVLEKQLSDYRNVRDDLKKVRDDEIAVARASIGNYRDVLALQKDFKIKNLEYMYGIHDSYINKVINLDLNRLQGLSSVSDFYQKRLDEDQKTLAEAEELLRHDLSLDGVAEEIINSTPGVSLITSIPKQTKFLIDSIKQLEEATDKTDVLIEDFEKIIGVPLVDSLRQLGLYHDPNAEEEEELKFGPSGLYNISEVQAVGDRAGREVYQPHDHPNATAFADNVRILLSSFDLRNESALPKTGSPWAYDAEFGVVYRVDEHDDIECASYDGRNCLWGTSFDSVDLSQIKALTCGEDHLAKWGTTGYENRDHWCFGLAKKSRAYEKLADAPRWVNSTVRSVAFRINENFDVECASYDGRNCLWGVDAASLNVDNLKPLACGVDHNKQWGSHGYDNVSHWCNAIFRSPEALDQMQIQAAAHNETLLSGWFWPEYSDTLLRINNGIVECAADAAGDCYNVSDIEPAYITVFGVKQLIGYGQPEGTISLEDAWNKVFSGSSGPRRCIGYDYQDIYLKVDCGIKLDNSFTYTHMSYEEADRDYLDHRRRPANILHPKNVHTHLQKLHYRKLARMIFSHISAGVLDEHENQNGIDAFIIKYLRLLDLNNLTDDFHPYMMPGQYMSGRPAALIYDDYQAYILLNKDLQLDSGVRFTNYLEELGSATYWSLACDRFTRPAGQSVGDCMGELGDEGARLVDALALFDLNKVSHTSHDNFYVSQLFGTPNYQNSEPVKVIFQDKSLGYMDGFSNVDDYGDDLKGGDKSQTMTIFQAGIEIPSEYEAVNEKIAAQFIYYAPRRKKLGDPSDKSENPDENVPTLWLQVAFHDEINVFAGRKAGSGSGTKVTDIVDAGAILIRNHGIELPFQKHESDNKWHFVKEHMNYYKEDILRLELDIKAAQFALKKLGKQLTSKYPEAFSGSKSWDVPVWKYLNSAAQGTIGVEFGLAFKFPYENRAEFYTAIGIDVATNLIGAISGAIGATVFGQDPVTFGEIGAIITDLAGSAIEEGLVGADDAQWVGLTFSLPFDFNMSTPKLGGTGGKTLPTAPTSVWYTSASGDGGEPTAGVAQPAPSTSGQPTPVVATPTQAQSQVTYSNKARSKMKALNAFKNANGVFAFYPRFVYTPVSRSSSRCGVLNRDCHTGAVNDAHD